MIGKRFSRIVPKDYLTNLTTNPARFMHTKLLPILEKQKEAVVTQMEGTLTKAIANTISSALAGKTGYFSGKEKKEVFEMASQAVAATANGPIHIRLNEDGFFTNHEIFRQLGLNTFRIINEIKSLVSEGLPLTKEMIEDAFIITHAFSKTHASGKLLDMFNKNNPGPQAYDLEQVKEISKRIPVQLSETEYDLERMTPEQKFLLPWLESSYGSETQKDIARNMFEKEGFKIPSDQDGIIKYIIGVCAGLPSTALSNTIVNASNDHRFFGCTQGVGWVICRMAAFNVSKTPFWMRNEDGSITRKALVENCADQIIKTSARLLGSGSGSLNRNEKYYFHTTPDVLASTTQALKETFAESIEMQKQRPEYVKSSGREI